LDLVYPANSLRESVEFGMLLYGCEPGKERDLCACHTNGVLDVSYPYCGRLMA
jgi:hypothetical protein